MISFRFGTSGQQLFGVFHPAQGGAVRMGVLLCNPFGQEAVRIHRFYRVLAERLAANGMPTLRFDYFGTGESDGDDLDGHIERWTQDVLRADEALRKRLPCEQVAWLGARLGGTLALHAAQKAPKPPTRLLLWEPITDGQAYLQSLASAHQLATHDPFFPRRATATAAVPAPPHMAMEALGFALSTTLVQQLTRLIPAQAPSLAAQAITVIAPLASPGSPGTQMHQPAQLSQLPHAQVAPLDWTSEEAINTALVPSQALNQIARHLEDEVAA